MEAFVTVGVAIKLTKSRWVGTRPSGVRKSLAERTNRENEWWLVAIMT